MALYGEQTARQFRIHQALNQYPLLSSRIRARMRAELFSRGVISPQEFENQVRRRAIKTQEWEGVRNPTQDEPAERWEQRLGLVRDEQTDFFFSQNLSHELFELIVWEVLSRQGVRADELTINPELAPLEIVFEQAAAIERMAPEHRKPLEARLKESKVVILRTLISDQLGYIDVAKEWFTIQDLQEIRRRKIGTGKIGGKSAGMLLALRILSEKSSPAIRGSLGTPDSYFIGSDVFYIFMTLNNLIHWMDQKYKTEDEMREQYPQIVQEFERGKFPLDILEQLRGLLAAVEGKPLIVRSSSLLEDNFGTSFAGKYDSLFCPNQGNAAENLEALTQAIIHVYASTFNTGALMYRRSKKLQDYDERMGALIQVVEGEATGDYFFPQAAGVAFSRNLYRWAPQIRREDGFMRLVWGLGTRAVDRVGNDFPRLVALSHPLLRPSNDPTSVRKYSQQYIDLIDLKENRFRTLPVYEVLEARYPPLRYLAQVDRDGYFESLRTLLLDGNTRSLVLTFDEMLRRTALAEHMRAMLSILEEEYHGPVDLEFTLKMEDLESGKPRVAITILQCRPLSSLLPTQTVSLPVNLRHEDIVFSTRFVVPDGLISPIDTVVYVPPEAYFALKTLELRTNLVRTISRLDEALAGQNYICVGPGRWGTSNPDLGVPVTYGDIYHTRALVELTGQGMSAAPEPSLGTHFFQDLLEAQIYPLAIYLDDPDSVFNAAFFEGTPDRAEEYTTISEELRAAIKVIRVSDFRPGTHLRVVMSDEKGLAVAYLDTEDINTI